jgi:hypothetical protein
MADEQAEKPKQKFPVEGLTVQAFFGSCAAAWMIYERSKGNTFEAGLESIMGTIFTGFAYSLYWLFKPRIMKWRGSE